MKIKLFLVLSSPVHLFNYVFGTSLTQYSDNNVFSRCFQSAPTLLYKGLRFKDIIDTYESEPSFLVSTEDISSNYLKVNMHSLDKSKVNLILNLERSDFEKVMTGPYITFPFSELKIQELFAKFIDQTGSSLKFVMLPRRSPERLVQALDDANVSVIFPTCTINNNTD